MKTELNSERFEIRISKTMKRDLEKYVKREKIKPGAAELVRSLIAKEIYPAAS